MSPEERKPPDSVKIQINSLEALERLIGSDSQLEMDIRQSVVDAFTRKHLKCLTQTEEWKALRAEVKKAIQDQLEEEIGKFEKQGFYRRFVLNDKYRDLVKAAAREVVQQMIDSSIREQVEGLRKKLTNNLLGMKEEIIQWAITRAKTKIVDELESKIQKELQLVQGIKASVEKDKEGLKRKFK